MKRLILILILFLSSTAHAGFYGKFIIPASSGNLFLSVTTDNVAVLYKDSTGIIGYAQISPVSYTVMGAVTTFGNGGFHRIAEQVGYIMDATLKLKYTQAYSYSIGGQVVSMPEKNTLTLEPYGSTYSDVNYTVIPSYQYPSVSVPEVDMGLVYCLLASNGSFECFNTAASTSTEQFVTRFYQQCLSREPDQGGKEHWVTHLTNQAMTGEDLAYAFIFSPEFIARNLPDSSFVTILYKAFFNRDPDSGGYQNWVNALVSGYTRADVLNGFTKSVEFQNLCTQYGISPY